VNSGTETKPVATQASAFVPSFARGLVRNLVLAVALPRLAVQLLRRTLAISDLTAIAIAIAVSVAGAAWRRGRVEIIGLIVLIMMIGGLARASAAQDAHLALMRAVPAATLVGFACVISLVSRAPLMFFVARQLTACDAPTNIAAWNERLANSTGFRRTMCVLTPVWGFAFLAKPALSTVSKLILPMTATLLTGPVIGFGTFAALMTWTIAYTGRGAARLAGAEAARRV
jgi:hypothetical protein